MNFGLQLCICMYIFSVDSIKVDEMPTAGTVHQKTLHDKIFEIKR